MTGNQGSLTDAQVRKIRKLALAGDPFLVIAEKFDIHQTHARAVAIGRSYAHVEGPLCELRSKPRSKKKGTRKGARKKTTTRKTAASLNGQADFTALTIDDASRFLQALSHEWPKIREAFNLLDSLLSQEADDGS